MTIKAKKNPEHFILPKLLLIMQFDIGIGYNFMVVELQRRV